MLQLLLDAESAILAFFACPPEHRRQIYATNPLERRTKELQRRSAVVGIFPTRHALLRLFGALVAEQNHEWLVGARRDMSETALRKLYLPLSEEETPAQVEERIASFGLQATVAFPPRNGMLSRRHPMSNTAGGA